MSSSTLRRSRYLRQDWCGKSREANRYALLPVGPDSEQLFCFSVKRFQSGRIGTCTVSAVLSIGRRNTELEV